MGAMVVTGEAAMDREAVLLVAVMEEASAGVVEVTVAAKVASAARVAAAAVMAGGRSAARSLCSRDRSRKGRRASPVLRRRMIHRQSR